MSEAVYPVSETIKYSDGSEKLIAFKLPEVVYEDEIAVAAVPEVVEEKEISDPMEGGIPKEAEEAPADSIEELA